MRKRIGFCLLLLGILALMLSIHQAPHVTLANESVPHLNKQVSETNLNKDYSIDLLGIDDIPMSQTRQTVKSNKITNDFYMLKPINSKSNNLVVDVNLETNKLILFREHGLGNQLFGIEWRPESDGYIIFLSKNKQILLKPEGNSAGSKITIETQTTSVNNLSRFSDEYLWDIEAVGENYVLLNKENKLALTGLNFTSLEELTLKTRTDASNQQIKIEPVNGYYSIKSEQLSTINPNPVMDILGGVGVDKNIIANKDYGTDSQKWFILYSNEINAYVIGNSQDKSILISSEQGEGKSPQSKRFNQTGKLDLKFGHVISPANSNPDGYTIKASTGGVHIATIDDTNLAYVRTSYYYTGIWSFLRKGNILPPSLIDFNLNKQEESPMYYAGETIDYSAKIETSDFINAAAFVRTDSGAYNVISENTPIVNNQATFTGQISTSEMTEGEHFVELLAKAEGLFVSNSLAKKVMIVYPTPTAEPVSQKVFRNRKIEELNAGDFVKEPHDEIGNDIEVTLVSLDTDTIGMKTAVISLKNQYKETLINVPVEIIKEPAKLQVDFMNEVEELLPGYSLIIDGFIGDPIDLTTEKKVIEQLENIITAGYEIVSKPENEANVAMDSTTVAVIYKLQGLISLSSAPTNLDFGTLTYEAKNKRIERPSFDKKLIVTDTRARAEVRNGFRISAVLTKALTNEKGNQLVDVLSYRYEGVEKLLGEQEQIVYVNTKGEAGIYAITDSWGSNQGDDGLKLQLKGTTMLYTGSYQGIITWKLMVDEPQ